MTVYLEILSVSEPSDIGVLDANGRVQFTCNYDALAQHPIGDFERDITKLISDAGLGTYGTNLFIGTKVTLTGDGPLISVIRTSGAIPIELHNGGKYRRLSCQVFVRASTYPAARDKAVLIWAALDGRRNLTVTP